MLPRPLHLGRSVRWTLEEIRAWLAAGAPSQKEWEQLRNNETHTYQKPCQRKETAVMVATKLCLNRTALLQSTHFY